MHSEIKNLEAVSNQNFLSKNLGKHWLLLSPVERGLPRPSSEGVFDLPWWSKGVWRSLCGVTDLVVVVNIWIILTTSSDYGDLSRYLVKSDDDLS